MKFNPKKLKRKLDYLPRWAWYMCSFFMAGPFGIVGVYLLFYVLDRMIRDYEQDSREKTASARRTASFYEDEDCTVTDEDDVNRRWQRTEASAKKAHVHQEQTEPMSESADVVAVIREGREAMRSIRRANDLIPDPELSAKIDSIEASCGQILSILEQRPQLLPQLRTFLRYYLPAALRLLDARAKLENTASTPKAREVRQRISDALGVIDKAFLKQVEALDEYRFIDLESEMDVLRDMLRADGLLDEEQPGEEAEDDPFAEVLSEKYGKPLGGH